MTAFVVLYDGECPLCHGTVQRLLRWDRRRVFRYAPLQGKTAAEIFARHRTMGDPLSGIWLVKDFAQPGEQLLRGADAALEIAMQLGGVFRFGAALARLFPSSWRQAAYRWIAENRYRWFGRCRLAAPGESDRFLA